MGLNLVFAGQRHGVAQHAVAQCADGPTQSVTTTRTAQKLKNLERKKLEKNPSRFLKKSRFRRRRRWGRVWLAMITDKSMKENFFFKKKWPTVTSRIVPSLGRSGVGVGISRVPPAALKPQKLSKLSKSDLLNLTCTNPGEFLGPNT